MKKLLVLLLTAVAFTAIISLTACSDNANGGGNSAITDGDRNQDEDNPSDVGEESQGLIFKLNDDGKSYSVSGIVKGNVDKSIVIPSAYKDLPVTAIADNAFKSCASLTSVTIPDSVTFIGDTAFYACSSLTSVTIPDGVTSVGDSAFIGCDSLQFNEYDNCFYLGSKNPYLVLIGPTKDSIIDGITERKDITNCVINETCKIISVSAFASCTSLTNITIPDSVTSIGSSAFYACSSLTSVTIPNSVTSIGNYAYELCFSLKSITIPNGVTSIGDRAFRYCTSLMNITIPDSVMSIGEYAFINCSSLNNITVSGNNKNYKSIDGNLYSKDGETLIQYAIGKTDTSFTIPDSVTNIVDCALRGCVVSQYNEYDNGLYLGSNKNPYLVLMKAKSDSITTCVINETCRFISSSAFSYCFGLTSVTIPNSVTSIGSEAFNRCFSLTSITIPDSVTSIGSEAFICCASLTSVTIPDSVTFIGDTAFQACTSLTSVVIGNGVTSIGDYAFSGCNKLVEVINNSKLNIVKGSSENGDIAYHALNVKKDGESDIVNKEGYLFYTVDGKNYLLGYTGTDKSLTLSANYNGKSYEIYNYAFYNRDITSIIIPDSVTSIGCNTILWTYII